MCTEFHSQRLRVLLRLMTILFVLTTVLVARTSGNPNEVSGVVPDTLTIIHVNDTHSNLLPFSSGKLGGMARAAWVISKWKASEPNAILMHSGDLMVGTLMFNNYFGVPELQLLQQLGFEVFLLGNHEFDVGAAQLGQIFQSAHLDSGFHILCSNARNLAAVPTLTSVVEPHVILQRGSLKVGIFGLTTPATNVESNPAPVMLDTSLGAVAQQEIRALRTASCQVVIMLSHLGLPLDRQLAAALSGLDAIIGGHSHDALQQPEMVNGVPIVQAGEYYHYVGKLRLVFDGTSTRLLDYTLKEIDASVPELPAIASTISKLRQGVVDAFTPVLGDPYQPLAENERLLSHIPAPPEKLQTDVGRLVTAAMHWYVPDADCALEPTGHIVENLYPGAVTPTDLFRVYPYGYDASDHLGFRLATVELTGTEIQAILAALATHIDFSNGKFDYLLQSQGLQFTLIPGPSGLTPRTVTLNGKPIQPDSLYTVATSSRTVKYLKNLFGIEPRNLHLYPVSVVQVLTEFVKHYRVSVEKMVPEKTISQFRGLK